MGTSLKLIMFTYLDFENNCQGWKRRAPINDEDPSNKISKIMDMGPISTRKHEWNFINMVPISITKHKMTFFVILRF